MGQVPSRVVPKVPKRPAALSSPTCVVLSSMFSTTVAGHLAAKICAYPASAARPRPRLVDALTEPEADRKHILPVLLPVLLAPLVGIVLDYSRPSVSHALHGCHVFLVPAWDDGHAECRAAAEVGCPTIESGAMDEKTGRFPDLWSENWLCEIEEWISAGRKAPKPFEPQRFYYRQLEREARARQAPRQRRETS